MSSFFVTNPNPKFLLRPFYSIRPRFVRYYLSDKNKKDKRETIYNYTLLIYTLIWILKRFWFPKWFWLNFCHKKSTHLDHSYLKYTLTHWYLLYSNRLNIRFQHKMWSFKKIRMLWTLINAQINHRCTRTTRICWN